jgi:hypothetical protein
MLLTINQHWRRAKLLREKAEKLPLRERRRCLMRARLHLALAEAQLRDPSLRLQKSNSENSASLDIQS